MSAVEHSHFYFADAKLSQGTKKKSNNKRYLWIYNVDLLLFFPFIIWFRK